MPHQHRNRVFLPGVFFLFGFRRFRFHTKTSRAARAARRRAVRGGKIRKCLQTGLPKSGAPFFSSPKVNTVKKLLPSVLSAAVLGLAMLAPVGAADLRIGVVNMERILRDSLSAAQAGERLNAEGMRRQEEIDALTKRFKQRLERFEKGASDMSESERVTERRELAEMERDVARRSREARDEFNQRRNEEVLLLQGRAGRIIQQIAETEKFDLVLYEFFYASPKVDITDRVMKALDADVKPAKKKK